MLNMSGIRWSWPTIGVVAWMLLAVCNCLAAPSFTTALDRNVVPVGETVTLSLIFEGANPTGAPTLPAFRNLVVAPGEIGRAHV